MTQSPLAEMMFSLLLKPTEHIMSQKKIIISYHNISEGISFQFILLVN